MGQYVKVKKLKKNKLSDTLTHEYDEDENEYFDAEAVRLSFLQFFIEIFRHYRNYLEYTDTKTLNMSFNKDKFLKSLPDNITKFVSEFMDTHSFEHFLNERCSAEVTKQNPDLITFDYCIEKTMQSVSSDLNMANLMELNKQTHLAATVDTDSLGDNSSTTTTSKQSKQSKASKQSKKRNRKN